MTSPVFEYTPDSEAGSFTMMVLKEGTATVDGREFAAGAVDWREPPVPLLMTRANEGRGHNGSSAVGVITEFWAEPHDDNGNRTVYAKGYFSADEQGQTARRLVQEGTLAGVSADVGAAITEDLAADDGSLRKIIHSGTCLAVTLLPIPAFSETKISVDAPAPEAITASASWVPDGAKFVRPNLTGPTPLTVRGDHVFGHAALFGACHTGYRDRCVTPPRSGSDYSWFKRGVVETTTGPVTVGTLTAGANHAHISFGMQPAREHYDNTGYAAAFVNAGEDEFGIWFSGVLAPSATVEQVATLTAGGSVSGDWREVQRGRLELMSILAVNSPGFPVPRARAGFVASSQVSLIASSGSCCSDCAKKANDEPEEFAIVDGVVIPDVVDGEAVVKVSELTEVLGTELDSLATSDAIDAEHADRMEVRANAFADAKAMLTGADFTAELSLLDLDMVMN